MKPSRMRRRMIRAAKKLRRQQNRMEFWTRVARFASTRAERIERQIDQGAPPDR